MEAMQKSLHCFIVILIVSPVTSTQKKSASMSDTMNTHLTFGTASKEHCAASSIS